MIKITHNLTHSNVLPLYQLGLYMQCKVQGRFLSNFIKIHKKSNFDWNLL